MDRLIERLSSIEKKLSLMSSRKRTNLDLDLPLNGLVTFKAEVEKANQKLASLNGQVRGYGYF